MDQSGMKHPARANLKIQSKQENTQIQILVITFFFYSQFLEFKIVMLHAIIALELARILAIFAVMAIFLILLLAICSSGAHCKTCKYKNHMMCIHCSAVRNINRNINNSHTTKTHYFKKKINKHLTHKHFPSTYTHFHNSNNKQQHTYKFCNALQNCRYCK